MRKDYLNKYFKFAFFSLFLFFISIKTSAQILNPDPIIINKLFFGYDEAGNQVVRRLCSNCENVYLSKITHEIKEETEESKPDFIQLFTLYPNPTDGFVKLAWKDEVDDLIQFIELVGMSSPYYKAISISKGNQYVELNLTDEYTGIYIFEITLNDGTVIHKKLLKQ